MYSNVSSFMSRILIYFFLLFLPFHAWANALYFFEGSTKDTIIDNVLTDTSHIKDVEKKDTQQREDIYQRESRKIPENIQLSKDNYHRKTTITNTTTLKVNEEELIYKNTLDFTTNYHINTLSDSSGYVFDILLDNFDISTESMGVIVKFTSDSLKNQLPATSFAKDLYNLLNKKISVKINRKGEIIAVDTASGALELMKILSKIYLRNERFEQGQAFSLVYSLPSTIYQGMKWEEKFSGDSLQFHTEYNVKNFFRDNAVLEIKRYLQGVGEIATNEKVYNSAFKTEQLERLQININSGLVETRDIAITLNSDVELSTGKAPSKINIQIKERTN